jgi:hypothetical protein
MFHRILRREVSKKGDEIGLLNKEESAFYLPEESEEEPPKMEWSINEEPEDDTPPEVLEEEIKKLQIKLNRRRSSIPYLGNLVIDETPVIVETVEVPVLENKKKIVPKYRS